MRPASWRRVPSSAGNADIEMAPLIDMLFLLLVFFLVTTTFDRRQTALELDLPGAVATQPAPDRPLRLELTSQQVAIDGVGLTWEQLPAALSEVGERPLLIASDGGVAYERFVNVLDLARAAGLQSVTLEVDAAPPSNAGVAAKALQTLSTQPRR